MVTYCVISPSRSHFPVKESFPRLRKKNCVGGGFGGGVGGGIGGGVGGGAGGVPGCVGGYCVGGDAAAGSGGCASCCTVGGVGAWCRWLFRWVCR